MSLIVIRTSTMKRSLRIVVVLFAWFSAPHLVEAATTGCNEVWAAGFMKPIADGDVSEQMSCETLQKQLQIARHNLAEGRASQNLSCSQLRITSINSSISGYTTMMQQASDMIARKGCAQSAAAPGGCVVPGNPKPTVCQGISAAKDCRCYVFTNNCAREIIVQFSWVGPATKPDTLHIGGHQTDSTSVCTKEPTESVQYNGWKSN